MVGCTPSGPSESDIQTAIAQTQQANQSSSIVELPTDTQESIINPPETSKPTNTSKPVPNITPTVDTSQIIAKNFVASQESGGVIVEIARILIGNRNVLEPWAEMDFSEFPNFIDRNVLVEVIFRITNTTDKIVLVYVTTDGSLVVNGEQVNFIDYSYTAFDHFQMGLEIYSGATVTGGIWTGLESTPFDQINKIFIGFGGPLDFPKLTRLGGDYNFDIEVRDWDFDPLVDFDSHPIPEAIPTQNPLSSERTFTFQEINGNIWDLEVTNIEITDTIIFGTSEDLTETAFGRFAVIFMDVTNRNMSPESFFESSLQVKDANDKRFGANVQASIFASYNYDAYCSDINPDQTKNCVAVFDISLQSDYYILVPGDFAGKNNPGIYLNIP